METRAAVLRKTGADVVYCSGSQVFNTVPSEMPDLVVLCHSLAEIEAETIADKVHTCWPKTRVLLVVSQVIEERQYQDAKFDATSQPLSYLAGLIGRANRDCRMDCLILA